MAISCATSDLAVAAKCWLCVPEKLLRAIRIQILCNGINGVTMTCDVATLVTNATANGYTKLPERQSMAIESYLLCYFFSGGSSSESLVIVGTGSPVGVVTPTVIGQLYSDSNGGLWQATGLTSADWQQLI